MKTKTFIKRLEDELGYDTAKSGNLIIIRKMYGGLKKLFAIVTINRILGIDTSFHNFTSLDKHDRKLLFDLILEYAKTPLEEREEEKKYYVKLNNPILKELADEVDSFFLNQDLSTSYFLADKDQENGYQTQFTNKEIDNFPDEVKAVLPLCEKIEVTP